MYIIQRFILSVKPRFRGIAENKKTGSGRVVIAPCSVFMTASRVAVDNFEEAVDLLDKGTDEVPERVVVERHPAERLAQQVQGVAAGKLALAERFTQMRRPGPPVRRTRPRRNRKRAAGRTV